MSYFAHASFIYLFWVDIGERKLMLGIGIMRNSIGNAPMSEQVEQPAAELAPTTGKRAWSRPVFSQFDLSESETANTNSNFDGTNYSS